MSIEYMSQVWKDPDLKSKTELLVMLAIADYARHDGQAWPSVDSLALKARCTQRAVQKVVSRLVKAGKLVVDFGKGPYGTNVYRVMTGGVNAVRPEPTVPKKEPVGSPNPSGTVRSIAISEVDLPHGFPRTPDDAITQSSFVGCPAVFCNTAWNKAMSRGGNDAKGNPIRSFRHYLATEWAYEQNRQGAAKSAGSSTNGADRVILGKEYERVIEQMRTIRVTYEGHQTWTTQDRTKFNTLAARKKELKTILGVVV